MLVSFSDRVGDQTQVHLKSWERGIHDQHSLTQLDQKGIEYYYRVDCITTHMSLSNSRALTWVCVSILFLIKLGQWVLVMCASNTFSKKLVREPQLDQKKISTPSFLHCRAQSGSKGPFPLNLSAWLRSFTLAHSRSFTHFQKPHFQLRIAPCHHT